MRKGLITLIALTMVLIYAPPAAFGADATARESSTSSPPAQAGGVPLSVVDNRNAQPAQLNKPDEYQEVPTNKSWTLVFSEELDPSSLTEIFVSKDPFGAVRVPVLVSRLPQFNNMVSVAPESEWEAGATYYLSIGEVKSVTGKPLNEKMVIAFSVKKESVEELLDSANTLLFQMKLPEAIQSSEDAIDVGPLDYRGEMYKGMAYMPFDKEKALEELMQSTALNPNDSQLLFLMSFISRTGAENGNPKPDGQLSITSLY